MGKASKERPDRYFIWVFDLKYVVLEGFCLSCLSFISLAIFFMSSKSDLYVLS